MFPINSVQDEVRSVRFQFGDAQQPCLAITYSLKPKAAEVRPTSQNVGATIAISATGGTGSKLLITLVEHKVDQSGTATTDTTTSINGATYTTLKAVIDYINTLGNFKAWALNCPLNKSTNSDDFIDLSATYIPCDTGKPLECLYRDADQDLYVYQRVGIPEARDEGWIRGLRLWGTVTGATAGTVKIYRDSILDYKASPVALLQKTLTNTTLTEYLDLDKLKADDYQGPIIIEVYASNLSAADFTFKYMTGTY